MSQAHVSLGLIVTMTTTAIQCQPENARVFGRCGNSHDSLPWYTDGKLLRQASVSRATTAPTLDRRKTPEKSISTGFYRKDATRWEADSRLNSASVQPCSFNVPKSSVRPPPGCSPANGGECRQIRRCGVHLGIIGWYSSILLAIRFKENGVVRSCLSVSLNQIRYVYTQRRSVATILADFLFFLFVRWNSPF